MTQGLGAPTAGIAKDAGVSNGSLFTYFETKTELFNELYLELKGEMVCAAMKGVRTDADLHGQFFQVWQNWMHWAVAFPEKRGALAQLSISGELSPESRQTGTKLMAPLAEIVERIQISGSFRKAPLGFVLSLMNSVAEATMDYMTQDPAHATKHCKVAFEALWRMLQ